MSLLIGMLVVVVNLLLLAIIGYLFYWAFGRFGFRGVIFSIIGVAVLVGVIIFTSYVTINLGEINCNYNLKINQINSSTGKNYTIQNAFHRCNFDFFGTQSDGKNFFIKEN